MNSRASMPPPSASRHRPTPNNSATPSVSQQSEIQKKQPTSASSKHQNPLSAVKTKTATPRVFSKIANPNFSKGGDEYAFNEEVNDILAVSKYLGCQIC
jgi:hypothetical protein